MPDEKVKTYRNRLRGKGVDFKPYTPQYQLLGIEPQEYKSATIPDNPTVARPQPLPLDNPRGRRQTVRVQHQQPYAEPVPSPIGRGKGPIPNVGNNVEHTWSSVDGEIVDDISGPAIDPNHPMVDNNDFVETLPSLDEVQNPPAKIFTNQASTSVSDVDSEDLTPLVYDLEEGAYLLILDGIPVCSGPKEEIQEQAAAMLYGEHEICNGNPVPESDIIIIKRVPIKIGLFLE